MSTLMLGPLADAEIYRRCFEDSTDGIIVADAQGRILHVNRAWLTMHGYLNEAEVLGQTTRIVRGPHTSNDVYQSMWSQIGDPAKGFWKGELINRRKDGTELPVMLTITPVRADGKIAGYMAISIDLTERKQADELKRLYNLVLWHDLKSPLASIRTVLDALATGFAGELQPDQQELVHRANRQAQRMSELIASTLDAEKLASRKLELDLKPVDLFALTREALQTLAGIAVAKKVALEFLADGRPAGAADQAVSLVDPLHSQRCVENLVKNAIEAAPKGSTVRVVLSSAGEPFRLSVHNDGPPIPAEVRATLFHPFGTYGKRGTGLGLYSVKMFVEAMGGRVGYETGAGGTTFSLELPRAALAKSG